MSRLSTLSESAFAAEPLYSFARPYGYDVSLVDNPEPLAYPIAKVRVLDSGGFAELSIRFRGDNLPVAIAILGLSVFLLWGGLYYDREIATGEVVKSAFALLSALVALVTYSRKSRLKRAIASAFPEARPAA